MKATGCKIIPRLVTATIIILTASLPTPSILADTYFVDRSFSDGGNLATLTGTLSIPEGNYTLTNSIGIPGNANPAGDPPNPFTAASLTLTINGTTSYPLTNVLTFFIFGRGMFSITASPTALVFNAKSTDGSDPAYLTFSDQLNPNLWNRYGIGSDGIADQEYVSTYAVNDIGNNVVDFPVTFGVVPEPSTLALLTVALGFTAIQRCRTRPVRL